MSEDIDDIWKAYETEVDAEQIRRACDEARSDQVVCRECARAFGQITAQHLQIHEMTLEQYESKHPDASVYPDDTARQPGRKSGFSHPDETKQKIAESTKQNHERGVYE